MHNNNNSYLNICQLFIEHRCDRGSFLHRRDLVTLALVDNLFDGTHHARGARAKHLLYLTKNNDKFTGVLFKNGQIMVFFSKPD